MNTIKCFMATLPTLLLSLEINFGGGMHVSPTGMKGSTLSALLILAWTSLLQGAMANKAEIDQHIAMGQKMLAAGQMADALSHFHAAIDGDPTNYMTYYRRATVYLAMGKSKSALPDLDKVIELKPDFTSARLQRANVKLKQGHLTEARVDYEQILVKEPGHVGAREHVDQLAPLQASRDTAQQLYDQGHYQEAVDTLATVIETCPWDPDMRELRAECYIKQGDYFKAVGDIQPTTKLRNDNTAAFFKLSELYYHMGEADTALAEIRECLKLDPDHKQCFPLYKKQKKLVKQMESTQKARNEQRWEDCVNKADAMMVTEPHAFHFVLRAHEHKCHCYSKAGSIKMAFLSCDDVLKMDPNNAEAMCDKAEAFILDEDYEEAVAEYQRAEKTGASTQRVEEGLKRAQKLLKQSQKRDYYKILGVKRNANKREIEKAFRKLAVQWHPDKYETDDEKEKAQKVFIDLAAAKEVLTDPEMRQKFDNGEDPLDAEEQAQGGHGNPFHQGFNPFGQGGFQFKYHYN